MPVNNTYRSVSIQGDGSVNQVFLIPLGVDTSDDLTVYEGEDKSYEDIHYTVNTIGIAVGLVSELTRVTWIGATNSQKTYTFVRTTPALQPSEIDTGVSTETVEESLNRVVMQCQEGVFATLEEYSVDGKRIQVLGAPINSTDASTYLYSQARYSESGNIPPGITDSDEGKYLYSESESKVGWKNPNALPTPDTNDEIMRVKRDGSMGWETPPTYTPTLGSLPEYLSVDSDGSSIIWRPIADLPDIAKAEKRWCITCQEGGTVAWEEAEDVFDFPELKPISGSIIIPARTFILQTWTRDSLAFYRSTDIEVDSATYIASSSPTQNFGSRRSIQIRSGAVVQTRALLEVDVSSGPQDPKEVTKVILRLYKTRSSVGSNTKTAVIGRLKQPFVENEATWQEYSDGNAWPGGAGAQNDIDYTMHCMPLPVHGKTNYPDNASYEYDITYMYLDAIENQENVLRLMLFIKSSTTPDLQNTFSSNDDTTASKRPTIHIEWNDTKERSSQWFGCSLGRNYSQLAQKEIYNLLPVIEDLEDTPAINWYDSEPHYGAYLLTSNRHLLGHTEPSGGQRGLVNVLYVHTDEPTVTTDNTSGFAITRLGHGPKDQSGIIESIWHESEVVNIHVGKNLFHDPGITYTSPASTYAGTNYFYWSPLDLYAGATGSRDGNPCHECC